MTNEFKHYEGCKGDPVNCSACALTKPVLIEYGRNDKRMGINYSAWPLAYIENGIRIPQKFMGYLIEELNSDNQAYLENLKTKLKDAGYDIEIIIKNFS